MGAGFINLDLNCQSCKNRCCARCFNIGESNIFDCLTKEQMEVLVKQKRHIQFKAGETILKQNTSASHLVCIKTGLAKIVAEGNANKHLILRLIPQHSIITGGGLFADEIRHFTVQAITEIECCFIESEIIIELINSNKQFAFEMLKLTNRQNMDMLNNLVSITQKYMPGRVADLLLHLKNDIFLSNPFETKLSRQELADMTSMTMESFIRILKEFKTAGIILTDGSIILILDEDALKTISKKG